MGTHVSGSYAIVSWDEKTWDGRPWDVAADPKVTHSIVAQAFQGAIEGEAVCQQLIAYCEDGTVSFVGLHRVAGSLGGLVGGFVLQSSGTYADGAATASWIVVPGSGTGDLHGLRGHGGYTSRQEDYPSVAYTLDYSLEVAR